MVERERAARWRVRLLLVSLAAGGLAGVACMGSVDRVYTDGGSAPGSDATLADGGTEAGQGTGEGAGDDAAPDAYTGADATSSSDAASDAGPDAQADAPFDGQVFNCNGTSVTSCAACTGKTQECVYCASDGGHPGVCTMQGQLCSNPGSAPPNAMVCTCPGGNVQSCPAPFQTCTPLFGTNYCQTCGEQYSDTHACKGGGTCHAATGTCN
jgi:hypothetical protein